MDSIYKEINALVQEFAEENDMSIEEGVKELEARMKMDFSRDTAKNISIYLDRLMVLHTRSQQKKLLISVMAQLLNDLVNTKFTLSDAIKELKSEYMNLIKKPLG